jgi:hypothetical protein
MLLETPIHRIGDLFRQMGLPGEPAQVDSFIAQHHPLPEGVALADAPWWSASQALFLREALAHDADWAEVVDQLSARLRG